jgi:signal transduction histidine kinase
MAKRALSGVDEISRIATAISEGALECRVPLKGRRDEIDRLAGNFNSMVERMEGLIKGMKEMNDNIAHDLRSPITRMRGFAEVTLTGSNSLSEYQSMASTVLEECDRLLAMINTMLDISEAETGLTGLRLEEVNIEELIRDVLDLFGPVIDAKGLRTDLHTEGHLITMADTQKIQRVLSNLLDNAIKYTPQGGSIHISATGTGREVRVALDDTGIGIPGPELPHIFDRFFRGERSRSEPGSGLGLSLARALVAAHRGSIAVTSTPGEGTQILVTLPKAQL